MKMWDVDANGSVGAFSDGLMIFKYIIGQRGNDLTNSGALIGGGALRDTNEAIEGYIEQILPYLDINGDGVVDYIDAQLILRSLLGLSGANLTDDATRPAGTRTTSDELIAYKNKMVAETP